MQGSSGGAGVMSARTSVGCACAAIVAYGLALTSLVRGYHHGAVDACPHAAPAPAAFWPLLGAAVALAAISFATRPGQRDSFGDPSGVDLLAIVVLVAVLLAAVGTIVGYRFTYGCWE